MTTPTAQPTMWFLTPFEKNIQVVKRDTHKKLREYLNCERVDCQTFYKDDNTFYSIVYVDEGMYNPAPYNKCAERLIGKIDRIMWGTFTGYFLVCKYIYTDDGERQVDMDMSPREFVNFCQSCRSDITGI
jgi:hypothetical protein